MKRIVLLTLTLTLCLAMVGCGGGAATLTVSQIPWPDGEETGYVIQDQDGNEIGTAEMTISRDGDTYEMTFDMVIGDSTDNILMTLNADDLKPISETRTIYIPTVGTYELSASYSDNQITVEAETPDGHEGPLTFDIPADSFANDEVWYLFRTLPFEEGYTATYTNVSIQYWPPPTPKVTITITGTEVVETPAGSFDCWELELTAAGQTLYFWIGIEEPNYMVKYADGTTIILLTSTNGLKE